MEDRFKFRFWDKDLKSYWREGGIDLVKGFVDKTLITEQCTGAKDMNGKFIYEGDIVKFYEYNYEVYFNENTYGFSIWNEKKEVGYNLLYHKELEVIGNIHENPELLQEQNNGKN